MNKQQQFYTKSSLRFTRWSRAAYAVFKSLSSAVTIGFLSVSISDSSLKESIHESIFNIFVNDSADDEIAEEELLAKINETNLLINCVSLNQKASIAQSLFLL